MQNTAIFQHTPPLYTRGKVSWPRNFLQDLLYASELLPPTMAPCFTSSLMKGQSYLKF